jgi:DNA polymerase-3 subunit alpha
MLSRAAIRDVGRVLDIPYGEVDKIAKMVPQHPSITLKTALMENRELRSLVESRREYQELVEIAMKIEGLVRNVSTHAAGVVIAPGKIWEYTPLYMSTDGTISTQFDMKSLEELGLLKIDFLGLRTLTVIQWAVEEIKKKDPDFSLERIPLNDRKTFRMISRGETLGVFQMEGKGFREMLTRIKPSKFEDIIVALSLYRPGPLQSGMREAYIARKSGKEPVAYPIPRLKRILKDTYGVIVYQEQVMQIAAEVAGFSLAQADVLRRAMGKKKKDVMARQRAAFIEGAKRKGIDESVASKIFDDISHFAEYGFNKSHSTGYAFISYWTAYLKANYPAEFITACLSTEMQAQNFQEKIHQLVKEAKRLKLKILTPNINESHYRFTLIDDKTIAYGLGAIKNVGESAVEEIVKEREENGNFASLDDFLERIDFKRVNKKVTESLIKAGAFDELHPNRTLLLKRAADTYRKGKKGKGLPTLFALGSETPQEETVEREDVTQRLAYEKEVLGFFMSGHPLDRYRKKVRALLHIPSSDLEEGTDGEKVYLLGTLVGVERKRDRQGRLYALLTFEDYDGEFQGILFADLFEREAPNLQKDESYYVEGTLMVEEEGRRGRVRVTSIKHLKDLEVPKEKPALRIYLEASKLNEEKYQRLAEILREHSGKDPLEIMIRTEEGELLLRSKNFKVSWDGLFLGKISRLLGEDAIRPIGKGI